MRRLHQIRQILLLTVRQQMRNRVGFFFSLVFPLLLLFAWSAGHRRAPGRSCPCRWGSWTGTADRWRR